MKEDELKKEREAMKKMTLGEHLKELRVRLIISLVATVLCASIFLAMGSFTLKIAMYPYFRTWTWLVQDWMKELKTGHENKTLTLAQEEVYQWIFGTKDKKGHYEEIIQGKVSDGILKSKGFVYPRRLAQLGPIEYIVAWMKIALIFGLVIASPIVFHQAWKFIAAGLYSHEKKKIMKILPYTVGLFITGVAFSYFVMIPYALYFLTGFADQELIQQTYTIKAYISFFFTVTLAMGVVFELPVFMVGIAKLGVMSTETMAKKRKIFILLAFVLGALLTPPDPFTQVLLAIPIIILFETGLFFARRVEKKKEAKK